MMRRILSTCAAITFLGCASLAAAASHTVTAVNLRSEPYISGSNRLVTLPAGMEVVVIEEDRSGGTPWVKVATEAGIGWIRSDLVRVEFDDDVSSPAAAEVSAPEAAKSEPHFTTGVTATNANLRDRPEVRPTTFVRTVSADTKVEVLEQTVSHGVRWYRVKTDRDTGWLYAKLIRPLAAVSEVAAAPAAVDAPVQAPPVDVTTVETVARPEAPDADAAEASVEPVKAAAEVVGKPARAAPMAAEPATASILPSALRVADAEAAVALRGSEKEAGAPFSIVSFVRDSQILLAALLVSLVLLRFEHGAGRRGADDPHRDHHRQAQSHVDSAIAHEGVRRDYDRVLSGLYAIERLLLPNGNGKSVFDQLTELVAAVNTATSTVQRMATLEALRKRMLDSGLLAALSRAFEGLHGYTFDDELRGKIQAFLRAPDESVESYFEEIRESVRLCFDDLSQRLVADALHSAGVTFLFSRRLEVLEGARDAARSAGSRGWTTRDVVSIRQKLVHDLFSPPA